MTLSLPTISATTDKYLKRSSHLFRNPHWSVLKASGSNIREYLQGQITQDMGKLNDQQAIHSCLLSPQGKAVSELYILAGHNDELIILTPSTHAVATVARLRQFALGQELRIGVVDHLAVGVIHGAGAVDMLASFGLITPQSHWLACSHNQDEDSVAMVMQNEPQVCWLITSQAQIDCIQADHKKSDHTQQNQINPANHDNELEALRILQGLPIFGIEWDERLHPLNANLIEFDGVDFKKGCYVGQEVTSRMHWRGGIKKKLYRVHIHGRPLELPCPIRSSANIGELKSAAINAQGDCFGIALLPIETVTSKAALSLENESPITILEACHA